MTGRMLLTMPRVFSTLIVLGLLMAPIVVPSAHAEDPALAKELYMEARVLMKEGRIRESLHKLKAAHEAYADDAILVSIANRHLDLGEPEEASQVLSLITSSKRAIKKQVKRLRREVGRTLAEPVTVIIEADVPGATVSIDGGPPRELPARLQLPRGSHNFAFRAQERTELSLTKILKGSLEFPLSVSLAAHPGRYRVAIEPAVSLGNLKIMLDGQRVVLSPEERRVPVTEPRELSPGKYKISCIRGFEERVEASLEIRTGEVSVATCHFGGGPATSIFADVDRGTLGWAAAGGAGVALISAIGYYVSYEEDLELYPPPRYEIDSTKPVASALLGVTAAGLSGLSYWLLSSDAAE